MEQQQVKMIEQSDELVPNIDAEQLLAHGNSTTSIILATTILIVFTLNSVTRLVFALISIIRYGSKSTQ